MGEIRAEFGRHGAFYWDGDRRITAEEFQAHMKRIARRQEDIDNAKNKQDELHNGNREAHKGNE